METKTGSEVSAVTMNRYAELMAAIPTKNVTATDLTRIFVKHWVLLYSITDWLLTSDGTQLIGMFLDAVCATLGTKLPLTIAYHSQTNVRAEQYSKNILSLLLH